MTIQQYITTKTEKVKKALNHSNLPDREKAEIISAVKELGRQWLEANAHTRVACIAMGKIRHGDNEEFIPTDDEQMQILENDGSRAIIAEVGGLATYTAMVQARVNRSLT